MPYGYKTLPLTRKQHAIYSFIHEQIIERGYAPSYEEIGKHFNLSSLATIWKHVHNLMDKGYIKHSWNRARSLEIVRRGSPCPHCGQPMYHRAEPQSADAVDPHVGTSNV